MINAQELVGKTEAEATTLVQDAGMALRVLYRSGKSFMGTCDFRMDRVNLSVTDGVVTEAHIG